ncbi:MAG: PH domain-containing protein [Chloroflexi bacterium]|nr:PH domain-containing protein [Chloroflexota bacterium]MBU1660399.1 PH domain-containing protein [Chloroflexota bacterium]
MTFLGLAAGAWSYADWRNDYFFVTNVRVVWRERILLRGSSRQETPLRTIQSLNVQTRNILARALQMGDVIVRTFNSELRMTDVYHPERMKNMIEGFLQKSRQRSRRAEHAAIRQTIRRQLGYQVEDIIPEEPEEVPPAAREKTRRLAIFKTRIVDGGIITYRKHWYIFFKGAWLPSLLLISVLLFSAGLLPTMFEAIFKNKQPIWSLVYLIPLGLFLWWLYEYMDWRNDIYRVTRNQIIDREKSPFGKESFRSAPVANIQSLGHKIPGLIGLILNVGDVHINVGDATFTFDGVHDPALVHQDVSRRMEELGAEEESARVTQEHGRMATWLDIYHDETKNNRPTEDDPDIN